MRCPRVTEAGSTGCCLPADHEDGCCPHLVRFLTPRPKVRRLANGQLVECPRANHP